MEKGFGLKGNLQSKRFIKGNTLKTKSMAKASSLGQAEIFMKEAIQMMKETDMVK